VVKLLLRRTLQLVPVLCLGAGFAAAHPLAPSLYELREGPDGAVTARFKRPRTQATAPAPEPRMPAGCSVLERGANWGEAGSRIETWQLRCQPAGLAGRWVEVANLGASPSEVVLRVELADGTAVRSLLTAAEPRFLIPERESAAQVLSSYGRLGFEHILSGLDHLLFVLGLVFLAGGGRRLVFTVTAFTLGHSLTLGLAALAVVRLAAEPVEIGIAASLLYLAVELARPGRSRRSTSVPLAAGFGLLHGLGFAGALQAAGLPAGAVPLALLGFNLGIEAGQLAFVGLLLGAVAVVRSSVGAGIETLTRAARLASAYALGTLSVVWLLERLSRLA